MPTDRTLKVNEIFSSIQGESTQAGRLCRFIRLAGCNLDCSYCDTRYARPESAGRDYPVEELVRLVAADPAIELVEITGGEPLAQPATAELCRELVNRHFDVMVETNGSLPIAVLPPQVRRILDCKLPGSGMSDRNLYENYRDLSAHDEVKFVISDRTDYEFAMRVIRQYDLPAKTRNLLFSPVWGRIDFETLIGWMLQDKAPARFQLQMHKVIWGAEKTGV